MTNPPLPEYEAVVADLVAELSRHKTAIPSLSDAVEANRELQARVEALGTMAQGVVEQANGILAEIRRLDAPGMSSRLSAVDSALALLSRDAQTLQQTFTATDARVQEALQAADAARAATETNQAVLEARVAAAIQAAADAGVAAMHALPAQLVEEVRVPVAAKLQIATILLYVLIAEVAIGVALIIVVKR